MKRLEMPYIPVTESGCWLFDGMWQANGYGMLSMGSRGKKKLAHRHAFELEHGPIPAGLFVCHKCDTPACVNPDHLFAGSVQDNNEDRSRKGRYLGTWNGRCKVTPEQVRAIRADPRSSRRAAPFYGLSRRSIQDIRTGTTWSHLT